MTAQVSFGAKRWSGKWLLISEHNVERTAEYEQNEARRKSAKCGNDGLKPNIEHGAVEVEVVKWRESFLIW